MITKHRCGHAVDVPPPSAPFVRQTFCYECEQLAKKLVEEQLQRFGDATKPIVKEKV